MHIHNTLPPLPFIRVRPYTFGFSHTCLCACVRARSGSLVTDFPHFPFYANPLSSSFFTFLEHRFIYN